MKTGRVLAVGVAWLGAVAAPLPAGAQQTPPGAVQPKRPLPEPPSQPEFDFHLEAPQRSPVPRAVDEVHFKLSDIHIEGAKVFSAADLRPLYADLIGKEIALTNILDVADAIEQKYRVAGFVLVRAYVPPQRVKDGIFTIKVSEGYVAAASVEGGNEGTQAVTRRYMQAVLADRPLQLATVERALLLTNDLPGVSATGLLRPSATEKGASDLVVSEAQPRFTGGLALDNRGSRFSGHWTMSGDVEMNGIFGADQLSANLTSSPNATDQVAGQVRYRSAIGSSGLQGSLFVTDTRGEPGSTLQQFGVLTNSRAAGARLSYPIERSRAETFSLDFGFTAQEARVKLNAFGLALSHDNWRVLDLGATYVRNGWLGANWQGTFDVAQGLPIFGATPDDFDHRADLSRFHGRTDFTKLSWNGRLTRPLWGHVGVALSVQGQYSWNRLITGEQVAFGGTQIGRGYDPGAITGDQGIGSSFELRYDSHLPQWGISFLEPYLFTDEAWAWFVDGGHASPRGENMISAGGGVRLALPKNINLSLELARTLRPVPGSDGGRQATKVLIDASVRF